MVRWRYSSELRQKLFGKLLMWLNDADGLKWLFDSKIFTLAEYLDKASAE